MSNEVHRPKTVPEIRPLTESDRATVLDLWETYYGNPSYPMLDAAIGDHAKVTGFAATVNTNVVGFAIAAIQPVEWIEDVWEIELRPYVTHTLNGVLYQSVVDPDHRGKGIGSRLTADRMKWILDHETDLYHAMACCWVRDDAPDARGIIERFGFEPVEYIERDYDSDHECVDCDDGCDCDAELFVRELPGDAR